MSYSDLQNRLGGVEAFASQARRPPEDVRKDIVALKRRLRRRNFALFDPSSRAMQWWDLTTTLGLLYTITVTPFEVAFLRTCGVNVLFFVNQGVNVVFVLDIFKQSVAQRPAALLCLHPVPTDLHSHRPLSSSSPDCRFFTPVRDQGAAGDAWIKSHRALACRYLRGWFIIDVLGCLPFDVIGILMKANCGDSSTAEAGDPGLLMLMKFVRLLRLLKRTCSAHSEGWEADCGVI